MDASLGYKEHFSYQQRILKKTKEDPVISAKEKNNHANYS